MLASGVDPSAYLRCKTDDEREVWEAVLRVAQKRIEAYHHHLAVTIVNALGKAFK